MKLVKEDIKNIDTYLKNNNIKYIDIRFELIDHLVSEYEAMENYPDLGSFLHKRLGWCKKIAEKKAKNIHWGYQKALWRTFVRLFANWKAVLTMVAVALVLSNLYFFVSFKIFKWILISPMIVLVAIQVFVMAFKSFGGKGRKVMVSALYLLNIFSLPHLFLHGISFLPKEWLNNIYFLLPYATIGFLINFSAISVFYDKRKNVQKEYEFLKTYLV